jgi:hypothetical protein
MTTNKTLLALSIAALLLAGCEKSAPPNNMQSATPQQAPANGANSASPGNAAPAGQSAMQNQTPMQEQAPPPAPEPIPEPPKPLVVPAGTALPIILSQRLSSHDNNAGEEFAGTLASDIVVDGEVAIPKGSTASGVITKSKKQGTFKGEADFAIQLRSIRVGGKSYPISSSTYAASVKGKGKRTGVMTGGAAAAGALIGGLAGGGKGAAIGAGVGAGGGLAASGATGGENVNLQAESKVTFKLTQSLTIDR